MHNREMEALEIWLKMRIIAFWQCDLIGVEDVDSHIKKMIKAANQDAED